MADVLVGIEPLAQVDTGRQPGISWAADVPNEPKPTIVITHPKQAQSLSAPLNPFSREWKLVCELCGLYETPTYNLCRDENQVKRATLQRVSFFSEPER